MTGAVAKAWHVSSRSNKATTTPTQSILRWVRRVAIGWGLVEASTLAVAGLSVGAGLPAIVVVFNVQLASLVAGLVVLVRMIRQGRREAKGNGHETNAARAGNSREGGPQCAI